MGSVPMFAGLDIRQQRDLMEMLRRLNQRGHTIVIITHSMEVAAEYANRVVVLKEGAILRDGPTRTSSQKKTSFARRRYVLLRWFSSATGWGQGRLL